MEERWRQKTCGRGSEEGGEGGEEKEGRKRREGEGGRGRKRERYRERCVHNIQLSNGSTPLQYNNQLEVSSRDIPHATNGTLSNEVRVTRYISASSSL